MAFIGAIDQGTTSSRFILFDKGGEIVSVAQSPFTQIFPEEGQVEHDPEELWESVRKCVEEALSGTGKGNTLKRDIDLSEIAAVGITNQRETTVVWDKTTGKPFHNALVWQDMRTQDICQELINGDPILGKDRFRSKTGLPISPYFAGTKITWLLRNVPEFAAAASRGDALFGTIDTWLLWKLSGGEKHYTDVTNASRTLLMDLATCKWDEQLCNAMGLPNTSMLPEIRSSSEVYFAAAESSPLAGVAVSGVMGDQQAALFGHQGLKAGAVKNTYGTGCFTLCNVGPQLVQSSHGLLSTVAYKLGRSGPTIYALEGSIPNAGACISWLVKQLKLIDNASSSGIICNKDGNGGVYFVPAFSGLYAPYWRDDARGVIVGLTRYADRSHIIRAAFESVCFQTREVCDAMRKDAEKSGVDLGAFDKLRVDGGMTVNDTLMQIQANILDADVVVPPLAEMTALGAAYAAGLAVNFFKLSQLDSGTSTDKGRVYCRTTHYTDERRSSEFARWKRAVKRTLNWAVDEDPDDSTTVASRRYDTADKLGDMVVHGLLGAAIGAIAVILASNFYSKRSRT